MIKVLYKETQGMFWFPILMMGVASCVLIAAMLGWGSKPIPLSLGIAIFLLFTGLSLPFYNLTITITETVAEAKFGIGWIKKKVPIENLDISQAQIVKLPWYAGIGYRWGSDGTFLNTRPGPAVIIKTKRGFDEFFVGTNNGSAIIEAIKTAQQRSRDSTT